MRRFADIWNFRSTSFMFLERYLLNGFFFLAVRNTETQKYFAEMWPQIIFPIY